MQNFLAWIIDAIYTFRGFLQMYIFRKPPENYKEFDADKNFPIIVIQGYMDRWGFMKSIADEISNSGYPVFVIPKLENNLNDISNSAKSVEDFIEEQKLKNVLIVGHSKGGLIGKYILVNLNKNKYVIGLVAISTPYVGSRMANYFKFLKSNQFNPENKLIQELWSHHEVNKKIIAIFPKIDNVIWSKDKNSLEGALENIYVEKSGHHRILFDKDVQEKIISSIKKLINQR